MRFKNRNKYAICSEQQWVLPPSKYLLPSSPLSQATRDVGILDNGLDVGRKKKEKEGSYLLYRFRI
jgi:hypothetical protein